MVNIQRRWDIVPSELLPRVVCESQSHAATTQNHTFPFPTASARNSKSLGPLPTLDRSSRLDLWSSTSAMVSSPIMSRFPSSVRLVIQRPSAAAYNARSGKGAGGGRNHKEKGLRMRLRRFPRPADDNRVLRTRHAFVEQSGGEQVRAYSRFRALIESRLGKVNTRFGRLSYIYVFWPSLLLLVAHTLCLYPADISFLGTLRQLTCPPWQQHTNCGSQSIWRSICSRG